MSTVGSNSNIKASKQAHVHDVRRDEFVTQGSFGQARVDLFECLFTVTRIAACPRILILRSAP